jgi:hypothetical protein
MSEQPSPLTATMKTCTACSVFVDDLDPALIRRAKDGRRRLDFVLARSREVVQLVRPGRIKGQRTLPCGEWRLVELTQESEPQTWSRNGGCNSLALALARARDHERRRGSKH